MKIVARFLAVILASLVFSLASSFILSRTLLHADYVVPRAKEAKVFDATAQLLPTLAVPQEIRTTRDGAALYTKLTQLITPAYVETKLSDYANQLEAHYRDGGPAPAIDLAPLASEAKAVGLDIDPAMVKPIAISDTTDQHIQNSVGLARGAQSIAVGTAIVLGLLVVLISIKLRDYSSLLNIVVINAWLFVTMWLVLRFGPGPLVSMIPTNIPELKPLTDTLAELAVRLTKDISVQYGIGAIGLAVTALLIYAIALISRLRHKSVKAA